MPPGLAHWSFSESVAGELTTLTIVIQRTFCSDSYIRTIEIIIGTLYANSI